MKSFKENSFDHDFENIGDEHEHIFAHYGQAAGHDVTVYFSHAPDWGHRHYKADFEVDDSVNAEHLQHEPLEHRVKILNYVTQKIHQFIQAKKPHQLHFMAFDHDPKKSERKHAYYSNLARHISKRYPDSFIEGHKGLHVSINLKHHFNDE